MQLIQGLLYPSSLIVLPTFGLVLYTAYRASFSVQQDLKTTQVRIRTEVFFFAATIPMGVILGILAWSQPETNNGWNTGILFAVLIAGILASPWLPILSPLDGRFLTNLTFINGAFLAILGATTGQLLGYITLTVALSGLFIASKITLQKVRKSKNPRLAVPGAILPLLPPLSIGSYSALLYVLVVPPL
jgi:hypothetical protein